MLNFLFFVDALTPQDIIQICDYPSCFYYSLFLSWSFCHLSFSDSISFSDFYIFWKFWLFYYFSLPDFPLQCIGTLIFEYLLLAPISHTPPLILLTMYFISSLLFDITAWSFANWIYINCFFSSIPIPWYFRFYRCKDLDNKSSRALAIYSILTQYFLFWKAHW